MQMLEVYFSEWNDWFVFDGDGASLSEGDQPAAAMSDWVELFGGLPAPDSAPFYGLYRFCEANAEALTANLPWVASEIGRNDGYATMLRFIHRWSGRRLYVPKVHAQFVEKIGCNLCAATHDRFLRDAQVGSQIEVPSAWGVFMALRRVAIAIAIRSRMPADEISCRFGVTMRSLR